MGKTSFNIKDPQTLVGFILGLLFVIIFGWIGIIILAVVGLIYYLVTKKDIKAALIGALVGIVLGVIIYLIVGAIFTFI